MTGEKRSGGDKDREWHARTIDEEARLVAATLKDLQQQIPTAAYPTRGQGVALDLNGKLPTSVLPRTVTGVVTSAGVITSGTGFTVAHSATGQFDITFTAAFTVAPVVVAAVLTASFYPATFIQLIATTGFTMRIGDCSTAPPVVRDSAFNFTAIEVR